MYSDINENIYNKLLNMLSRKKMYVKMFICNVAN
jgi:hypothetical protein